MEFITFVTRNLFFKLYFIDFWESFFDRVLNWLVLTSVFVGKNEVVDFIDWEKMRDDATRITHVIWKFQIKGSGAAFLTINGKK